ncbi:MAG: hypothetical protein ACTSU7_01420 [Candidatus Heimdallarchaeaceae archaeon]
MYKLSTIKNQKVFSDFDDRYWNPMVSLIGIANHRQYEKTSSLPIPYRTIEEMDCRWGPVEIDDKNAIVRVFSELFEVINDPQIAEEYGMLAEIRAIEESNDDKSEFYFTYPVETCTGSLEEVDGIKRSYFYIREDTVREVCEIFVDRASEGFRVE